MGINIFMKNLENCAAAKCAELRRDIVGYDPGSTFLSYEEAMLLHALFDSDAPFPGPKEEESNKARIETRIERLDSPGFSWKTHLSKLGKQIALPIADDHYAVIYWFEEMSEEEGMNHPEARIVSICSKEEFLTFLEQKRNELRGEHGGGGWRFQSRWDRLDSEEYDKFCSQCLLKLPFDYRNNCHGYVSTRLSSTIRALTDALERVGQADATPNAWEGVEAQSLMGIKQRWELRSLRQAVDGFMDLIREGGSPALIRWSEQEAVQQIFNFFFFQEPTLGPREIEKVLPFAEVILEIMRALLAEDQCDVWAVRQWEELVICLQHGYKYGASVSIVGAVIQPA